MVSFLYFVMYMEKQLPVSYTQKLTKLYTKILMKYYTQSNRSSKLTRKKASAEKALRDANIVRYLLLKFPIKEMANKHKEGLEPQEVYKKIKSLISYKNKRSELAYKKKGDELTVYLPMQKESTRVFPSIYGSQRLGLGRYSQYPSLTNYTNSTLMYPSNNTYPVPGPYGIVPGLSPGTLRSSNLGKQYIDLMEYIKDKVGSPGQVTLDSLYDAKDQINRTMPSNDPNYRRKIDEIDYIINKTRSISRDLATMSPFKSYDTRSVPIETLLSDARKNYGHAMRPVMAVY